jgi:hypothetical protein
MWKFFLRKVHPDKTITCYNNDKYYNLTKNIRNSLSLTSDDISYISKLPNENLVEIIIIYDKIVTLYRDEL